MTQTKLVRSYDSGWELRKWAFDGPHSWELERREVTVSFNRDRVLCVELDEGCSSAYVPWEALRDLMLAATEEAKGEGR